MEFKIVETHEKKDFSSLAFAAQNRRPGSRNMRLARKAVYLFAGIWFSGAAVYLFYTRFYQNGAGDLLSAALLCMFLVLGVVCLLAGLLKYPLLTWLAWKNYQEKGKQLTYSFTDEQFSIADTKKRHIFKYKVVDAVLEDDTYFFLFIIDASAHVLKKSAFTMGSVSEFSAFIAEKTGKPVEYIQ